MSLSRDWLFCPSTGSLLKLDASTGVASCAESGYSFRLANLDRSRVLSSSDIKGYRRKFGLEALTQEDSSNSSLDAAARATVDEKCPKCGHDGLEFYTMQLRSADEGQTVFFECPKCQHKYSQNT